ncbi:Salicylate biosynthesis isochorismate synthase [bioreactor metagenome]|uniref:Salicylate biosynthesis isochorismate synthase n=1 Tax=bioreactor metagenome TaxID=1076179 RepID=A0A645J2U3_9ZZZZ
MLDVVRELHPTPALGGEPKAEALRWLAEKEVAGRGLYGAPIGWLDLTEDVGEFAVGIRSGIFSGNQGLLYAGCGIVDDSDPEAERLEINT